MEWLVGGWVGGYLQQMNIKTSKVLCNTSKNHFCQKYFTGLGAVSRNLRKGLLERNKVFFNAV
jgi:hypothetical protein